MTSKRVTDEKREKKTEQNTSRKTKAKSKLTVGREKRNKFGKTGDREKHKQRNNETKITARSERKNEKTNAVKITQSNTAPEKKSNEKTLIIDDDDLEGMTVPPKDDHPVSPWSQDSGNQPRPDQRPLWAPPPPRTAQVQSGATPAKNVASKPVESPSNKERPMTAKSPEKDEASDNEDGDDEEEPTVKQFSFPAYKILSGASVAPVKMYPQKVVVAKSEEPARKHHWTTGLFQNSKLSLKTRMIRLFLIWIFFRVLNKQTAWLSNLVGIGIPDEEPPSPRVKPPPGERFIKVFREGDPNPFHVRVKRPL